MSEDIRPPSLNSRPKIELREGEKIVRAPAQYGLSGPWGRVPISEKRQPNTLTSSTSTKAVKKTDTFYPEDDAGLLVAHNDDFGYTRYIAFDSAGKTVFEMHLSDESLNAMRQIGWKKVRALFEQDLEQVRKEPFGSRSIDPMKKNPFRRRRAISQASRKSNQRLRCFS